MPNDCLRPYSRKESKSEIVTNECHGGAYDLDLGVAPEIVNFD